MCVKKIPVFFSSKFSAIYALLRSCQTWRIYIFKCWIQQESACKGAEQGPQEQVTESQEDREARLDRQRLRTNHLAPGQCWVPLLGASPIVKPFKKYICCSFSFPKFEIRPSPMFRWELGRDKAIKKLLGVQIPQFADKKRKYHYIASKFETVWAIDKAF